MDTENQSKGFSLALSGGGARGIVHLGVLYALEERSMRPSYIAGTSMGAVIGALYAKGMDARSILDRFVGRTFLDMFQLRPGRRRVFQMNYFKKLAHDLLPHTFEELDIPLTVCATNLTDHKPAYLSSGRLRQAVLASASIPVAFEPVLIDGKTFVDGGVIDNLPAKALLDKNMPILGVEVSESNVMANLDSMKNIGLEVIHFMLSQNSARGLELCDESIVPDLSHFAIFDFGAARDLYDIGYHAATKWAKDSKIVEEYGLSSPPETDSL